MDEISLPVQTSTCRRNLCDRRGLGFCCGLETIKRRRVCSFIPELDHHLSSSCFFDGEEAIGTSVQDMNMKALKKEVSNCDTFTTMHAVSSSSESGFTVGDLSCSTGRNCSSSDAGASASLSDEGSTSARSRKCSEYIFSDLLEHSVGIHSTLINRIGIYEIKQDSEIPLISKASMENMPINGSSDFCELHSCLKKARDDPSISTAFIDGGIKSQVPDPSSRELLCQEESISRNTGCSECRYSDYGPGFQDNIVNFELDRNGYMTPHCDNSADRNTALWKEHGRAEIYTYFNEDRLATMQSVHGRASCCIINNGDSKGCIKNMAAGVSAYEFCQLGISSEQSSSEYTTQINYASEEFLNGPSNIKAYSMHAKGKLSLWETQDAVMLDQRVHGANKFLRGFTQGWGCGLAAERQHTRPIYDMSTPSILDHHVSSCGTIVPHNCRTTFSSCGLGRRNAHPRRACCRNFFRRPL